MMTRTALGLMICLIVGANVVFAQVTTPASSRKPLRDTAIGSGVNISYYAEPDAEAAHTTLYIQGSFRSSNWKSFVSFTAIIAAPGQRLTEPKAVKMEIFAHTLRHPCWLATDHHVSFWSDGKLIETIDPRYDGTQVRKNECSEGLSFDLPFSSFEKLIGGKTLEVEAGAKRFKLKASQLTILTVLRGAIGKY